MHTLKDREGIKREDLKSNGCERKAMETSWAGNPQIHLTQDAPINQEQLNDRIFSAGGHRSPMENV